MRPLGPQLASHSLLLRSLRSLPVWCSVCSLGGFLFIASEVEPASPAIARRARLAVRRRALLAACVVTSPPSARRGMKVASAFAGAKQLLRRQPAAHAASSGSGAASSRAAACTTCDAARAAHELELFKLELADRAAARAEAAAERAAARAEAAAERAADRAAERGLWEIVLGVKRETAQRINFSFAGALIVASCTYLVVGMMYDSFERVSVRSGTRKDVRTLVSDTRSAHPPLAPHSRPRPRPAAPPRHRAGPLTRPFPPPAAAPYLPPPQLTQQQLLPPR